jgi:prepilin peptidase CpaA
MEFNMENFQIIYLSVLLVTAATIDIRFQKIPNIITYPSMLIALSYNTITNGTEGLLFSAGGIAFGTALFIIPYLMGGMGAGDAKLMGAIGGVLGVKAVFFAFLFIAAVGGIYALIMVGFYRSHFRGFFRKQFDTLLNFILTRKYIPNTEGIGKNRPRLCYGLAIAIGTGIYLILEATGYQILS